MAGEKLHADAVFVTAITVLQARCFRIRGAQQHTPRRAYRVRPLFFPGGNVKQNHRASSLIILVVVALIAMLPQGLIARQRASAKSDEIAGIVTQTSPSSITVRTATGDRDVRLTSSTVVRVDDQASSISAIAVGDKVEVHAQKEADGTSTALTVEVESHPSTEVEGTVKAVSATSITVTTSASDVLIALTTATRFLANGQTATTADVHVGDRVEVEVREQTDKTLAALVVKVQSESVHVRGTIAAVSASSITVHTATGDVIVALTSSTLIRMQGKVTNASMLLVGSRVEVDAVHRADQSLAAVTITIELANSLSEIEGSVTEVASDHLKVHTKSGDDVTVAVNADTIVRANDHLAGLADIKSGDRVSVNARANADGTFTALRIEVETEHGGGNDDHGAELTGNIASISPGAITVTTGGGATVTVKISTTTSIRRGDTTLTASDLKTGNHVEVNGTLNADGSITATSIKVEDTGNGNGNDDHHESVEFTGTVSAVSSTSITVGSTTATLTSSTVVRKSGNNASIADIKAGQRVEVTADHDSAGHLSATQVKIEDH
jgi:hypothetical protein